MCECGCGDYEGDFRLDGPDGIIYAIELKHPCRNCDAPGGIVIHRFSAELAREWGADQLPRFPFMTLRDGKEFDGTSGGIPVIDVQTMVHALDEHPYRDEDGEAVDEDVSHAIHAALNKTWTDWRKST